MTLEERINEGRRGYFNALMFYPKRFEKVRYLVDHRPTVEFLVENGFSGENVARLMSNNDYPDLLQWLQNNYSSSLKPLGFDAEQIAVIFRSLEWREKGEYLTETYESELRPLGFSVADMAEILQGPSGLKKLAWTRQHYSSISGIIAPLEYSILMGRKGWFQAAEALRNKAELDAASPEDEKDKDVYTIDMGPTAVDGHIRIAVRNGVTGELIGYKCNSLHWLDYLDPEKCQLYRPSAIGIGTAMMAHLLGELNSDTNTGRFRIDVERINSTGNFEDVMPIAEMEFQGLEASYMIQRQGRRYHARGLE